MTGAGLFLLQVERVPSCPLPPSPNESIFPEEGVNANVCCLLNAQRNVQILFFFVPIYRTKCCCCTKCCNCTFYLPHAICVTTLPMSSNTFLGLISCFVELCPSCPYPPAPNVNTPPSCKNPAAPVILTRIQFRPRCQQTPPNVGRKWTDIQSTQFRRRKNITSTINNPSLL